MALFWGCSAPATHPNADPPPLSLFQSAAHKLNCFCDAPHLLPCFSANALPAQTVQRATPHPKYLSSPPPEAPVTPIYLISTCVSLTSEKI